MNLYRNFREHRVKRKFSELCASAHVIIATSSIYSVTRIKLIPGCTLKVGAECQIDGSIIFERGESSVEIGDRTFMNGSIISATRVTIGSDVLVAWGTTIVDHNSHSISFSKRSQAVRNWRKGFVDWTHVNMSPIVISDKVWIGFNCIILKGVTVGEGAVVGAGSVVTKNVPPWVLVAGNPARIIREIPPGER